MDETKRVPELPTYKRYYKNESLIGTGAYKYRRYSAEQSKLAAPTNLSISGSVLSFDSVEGATSYNILADGTSIGVYVPS